MSLEFEKKLGQELSKLGIDFQYAYMIPGTAFEIDFYIKAPIRGLIEIKHTIGSDAYTKKTAERLTNFYYRFNKSIYIYLITFKKLTKSQRDLFGNLPVEFITVPDQQNKPEAYCAQMVRAKIVHEAIQPKQLEIKRYEERILAVNEEEIFEIKLLTKNEHEVKDLNAYITTNKALVATEKDENKKKILIKKIEKSEMQVNHLIAENSYLSQHLKDLNIAREKWKHQIASLEEQLLDLLKEDQKNENLDDNYISYARETLIESDPPKNFHSADEVELFKPKKDKPLWLQKDNIFNRKPINDGLFSDVLSSFQTFMSSDNFEILEKEVDDFEEEYRSKHYTTAVLRIGRTLEYVIYTLVKSWGVSLNRPTMERIDILNDQFGKLRKHLIYYYTSEEDEKEKNRKNLIQAFKETNGALVDMQTDLDQTHDVNPSQHKVNIDTLLRDVKNRYGKNEAVRNEINKLTSSELIPKLYLKRNEAAHADISGSRREFNEEEVKKMADNLNVILFHLANIHDNITKSSS